jgi:hypothetical protein
VRGLPQRRGDLVEVGEVHRVRQGRVGRVGLQPHGVAAAEFEPELQPDVVEEVVRQAAVDLRGRDVAVGAGELKVLGELAAVDVDRERARGALRHGVVDVHRVGRGAEGELHVLARGGQLHRLAADGLGGERALRVVGTDDGAVRARVRPGRQVLADQPWDVRARVVRGIEGGARCGRGMRRCRRLRGLGRAGGAEADQPGRGGSRPERTESCTWSWQKRILS